MQIRTADPRRGDLHDHIGGILDLRIRNGVHPHIALTMPSHCTHIVLRTVVRFEQLTQDQGPSASVTWKLMTTPYPGRGTPTPTIIENHRWHRPRPRAHVPADRPYPPYHDHCRAGSSSPGCGSAPVVLHLSAEYPYSNAATRTALGPENQARRNKKIPYCHTGSIHWACSARSNMAISATKSAW